MALFSTGRIDSIISLADVAISSLSSKGDTQRYMDNEDFFTEQVNVIFLLKRAVQYNKTIDYSSDRFQGMVAYLFHKVVKLGFTFSTSGGGGVINPPGPENIPIIYTYQSSDPYVDAETPPSISGAITVNVANNSDLTLPFVQAATNKFLIVAVPASQTIKTIWYSTALNNGQIPDQGWRAPFLVAGLNYYITREALAFDYTAPILLKA